MKEIEINRNPNRNQSKERKESQEKKENGRMDGGVSDGADRRRIGYLSVTFTTTQRSITVTINRGQGSNHECVHVA